MQQLMVTTDLTTLPQVIESNYEAVKAELTTVLQKYDGLVVTDENFKEMKSVRAEINKGIAVIKAAGTDTKNKLLAPFGAFDAKVKELAALAEEKRTALDVQIKEIEARRKADREKELQDYFVEQANASGFKDDLVAGEHFASFFTAHSSWLNETYAVKKSHAEIDAEVARCAEAVNQVRSIYSEDLEVVKAKAEQIVRATGFDIGKTCEKINYFKMEERRLAEARKRDEEARQKREAEVKMLEERRIAAEAAAKAAAEALKNTPQKPPEEVAAAPADSVSMTPMERAKAALRAARDGSVDDVVQKPVVVATATAEKEAPHPDTGHGGVIEPSLSALKPAKYRMGMRFTAPMQALRALKDFMVQWHIAYEVTEEAVKIQE